MTSGSDAIQSTFDKYFPDLFGEIDPLRLDAAKKIMDCGTFKVYKSTRSGLSSSAVMATVKNAKKILVIAPTRRILEETVRNASFGNSVQVLPNCFCLKQRDQIEQDGFLTRLPFPLPKCEECGNINRCPVTKILQSDCAVIAITYRKLEALMLSQSEVAKKILEKISHVDVVLLDEAHTISLPTVVRIPVFSEVEIPDGYAKLRKILQRWVELNERNREKINKIRQEANKGHTGRHLSESIYNDNSLTFNQIVTAWNELLDSAIHRKEYGISDRDILILRDITVLMGSSDLAITYVREKDGKEGKVYITGSYWTSISTLKRFLKERVSHANHLFVSGTLVEPYLHFFSDISGKNINDIVFPDINNTNDKMLIHPDKWRLSAQNLNRYLPRIIDRIVEICKVHPGKEIFIVAPNARKAKIIHEHLIETMGPAAPLVDYYRSDTTIGVENSARICIAIGLAELPSNTYDHQASGENEEARWIDSQRLRRESVDASTWQTWSRVKDPKGQDESRVYCIGVRGERIRSVVSWGPGRKLELVDTESGRLPDGTPWKKPIFRITVKELIKPPKICSENYVATGRAKGNIGEWVQRVEKYDPNLIFSEFENILPITNNRQNSNKLGIYNNPRDDFEVASSIAILTSLLAARFDSYAIQDKTPDASGRFGYTKNNGNLKMMLGLMNYHIKGKTTMGFYQIAHDDTVKWICFDIDDHKLEHGEEGVKADLRKLFAVLSKYDIPFLLEASGSPNSYHVWVLLRPTETHTAFMFSRQIISEAGIDCEVFPKQKNLTKNSKYGNMVKVPLGINRKNGVRSQFLDPTNFRPYVGLVPIPDIVCLREIEEPVERIERNTKPSRINQNQENSEQTPMRLGCDLRPCMQGVLSAKVTLEGHEGHAMRVAIAIEAWNTGLSVEQAIELFKDQADFKTEIARNYIEDIYCRAYHPYSCDKLKEQCKPLVDPYCVECMWPNGRAAKAP